MPDNLKTKNETIDGADHVKRYKCPNGCLFDPKESITAWAKGEISKEVFIDSFNGNMGGSDTKVEYHEDPELRCPECGEYHPPEFYSETTIVQ